MPGVSLMSERPVGPHLSARSSPRANEHPHQVCDGEEGKTGDFGCAHSRLLMVVRYGRGARVIDRRAGQCEVGHTALRLFAAANRCLRAFWASLVADEVCNRSIGYWLR